MATIDGKYITVESESPAFPVTVTEQPVEKSINLVDHVQVQARTLSLSGVLTGLDAPKTRAYIIAAKDKGRIISYIGRNAFRGLITDFSSGHDYSHADGMTFSMELREVRVATSSYVSTLPAPVKSQAAPVANKGTQQTRTKSASKAKAKTKAKTKAKASSSGKTSNKINEANRPIRAPIKPGSKWGTGNLL